MLPCEYILKIEMLWNSLNKLRKTSVQSKGIEVYDGYQLGNDIRKNFAFSSKS
jgi:hypothetical protein